MKQNTGKQLCHIIMLSMVCIALFLPLVGAAQEDSGAVLLEPELFNSIPGLEIVSVNEENGVSVSRVTDLGRYLNGGFLIGISVTAVLALIYITTGGIRYMVTTSVEKKGEARQQILAAVGGLVLALASFLILRTINPDLLEFNVVKTIDNIVSTLEDKTTPVKQPEYGGDWDVLDDTQKRIQLFQLSDDQVRVKANDQCKKIGQKDCTSIAGIPYETLTQVTNISKLCACKITITGGTEYWLHSETTKHGPGHAVVDLNSEKILNAYIMVGKPGVDDPYELKCHDPVTRNGVTFKWEDSSCSTGPHWHVEF